MPVPDVESQQPHPQTQQTQSQLLFHFGALDMNTFTLNASPEVMGMAVAHAQQTLTHGENRFPNQGNEQGQVDNSHGEHVNIVSNATPDVPFMYTNAEGRLQVVRRQIIRQSTFVTLPIEIHLKICEWLCVADILALRMTCKDMCRITHNGSLWLSAMKRLNLLLPILPPSSQHQFGEIKPFMAEYLVLRSMYLHENFTFNRLTGSLARQETCDRILDLRILPGSRFIIIMTQNSHGEVCASVWDLKLYRGGARLPLARLKLNGKPDLFEASYGTLFNKLHILIACVNPPVKNDATLQLVTRISIMAVSLELLEELADRNHSRDSFNAIMQDRPQPFTSVYETSVTQPIHQIAICDVQHTIIPHTVMVALVCRPRMIMFDYPELRMTNILTGSSSFLTLGPLDFVNPTFPTSIWKIKLMPWQDCVLVSQIIIGRDGSDVKTTAFQLFRFPLLGQDLSDPPCIGVQYLYNLSVVNVFFSNLEESWFSALRTPDKMLDSQFHSQPAPISIFVATKGPNGLAHLIMHPTALPDEIIPVREGKGHVTKFKYDFPLEAIRQETWSKDSMTYCEILPGAFFSLVYTRPPLSCALDKLGIGVSKEISRILGYRTTMRQYRLASVTTTGVYIRNNMEYVLEEVGSVHLWDQPSTLLPGDSEVRDYGRRPYYPLAVSVPLLDPMVAADLKRGVVTIGFDESTGILCYSVDKDTRLRFVDFGGRFRDELETVGSRGGV